MPGEIEAVAAIEMQRQLAIGLRGEDGAGQLPLQLDVIVDLAIRHQRGAARLVERLVAGGEIDDGKPGLHHADIGRAVMAGAIGAAMRQRRFHRGECHQRRRLAVQGHDAGHAAHQAATREKISR